jgi:hypothetical protein
MADRVQALETRLSIAATDPNATAADTHADGDPFAEDLGVDNDEHSELPDPPPRQFRILLTIKNIILLIVCSSLLCWQRRNCRADNQQE